MTERAEEMRAKVAQVHDGMTALATENERLRDVLQQARKELSRWGWGDERFGKQAQERSVVDTIAKIDAVLDGTIRAEVTGGDRDG